MMAQIAGVPAGHLPSPVPDWGWVERAVWTDRMLNALETGVQGGKWHSLIDKVYAPANLACAYDAVAANKGAAGVDGMTLPRYALGLAHHQEVLADELRQGTYRPHPVRRTYIAKGGGSGRRPLGIPCVRDRVAQRALKNVLEPIFEATFHPSSHGFRPGRGCRDALREVWGLMDSGQQVVVDADIRGFFDAIPKDRLLERVRERVSDGRVLDLVEGYLNQGVMEGTAYWEPETGTPQGAVISPLLANVFLTPFDWHMHAHGVRIVRYADDFVLLCRSMAEAERALELAAEWMAENGLELHPVKTRLVDMAAEGAHFTFLGYRFKRHTNRKGRNRILKLVSDKSLGKFRSAINARTGRCNGYGMPEIIRRVSRTLRGWYNYFKHCIGQEFIDLDGYVRRRLRRILRKRAKRRRGSGHALTDHKKWPNVFFRDRGYFSLEDAQQSELQSLRGTH